MMSDNQIRPTFFQILMSTIRILMEKNYSKKIIKKKCHTAFLGHNVYYHKVLVSELIGSKINVYCQALYSYFKVDVKQNFWGVVTKEELNKINFKKGVEKYFEKKKIGYGNYEDSNLAVKNYKKRGKVIIPKNFVFLHIFRDSPFGIIDNRRIFKDYYHWIKSTIKIINKANDKWVFKIHPSTKRWGENSEKILHNLINKYSTKKENILIDKNSYKNFDIFKYSKKIITFNGTSHLEAIASGLKPIIISNCTMTFLNKKSYYKPKNIKQYENLLLKDINFKVNNKEYIKLAKKTIYMIENYKSFGNDLNVSQIYPNDSMNKIKKEYQTISKNLKKNIKYFNFMGKKLANGDKYTYSKKFYLL